MLDDDSHSCGCNDDIVVVEEIKTTRPSNPILYTNGKTRYKGGPESFKAIIGTAELEKVKEVRVEPAKALSSFFTSEELKGVEIGDHIVIRNRRHQEVVVYEGFSPRRPKNALNFRTLKGTDYKGPVTLFIRKATTEDVAKAHPTTGRLT